MVHRLSLQLLTLVAGALLGGCSPAPFSVQRISLSDKVARFGAILPQAQDIPEVVVWRGDRACMQVAVCSEGPVEGLRVRVGDFRSGAATIPSSCCEASFLEWVLGDKIDTSQFRQCAKRAPGEFEPVLVADRLGGDSIDGMEKGECRPLWLRVDIPADARPGRYQGTLTVSSRGKKRRIKVGFTVSGRTLPPPSAWTFYLDLWQNPYAVARYHGVEPWSAAHFERLGPVMELLAEAGQKVVTATIIDRPWNGQTEDPFHSMVEKILAPDGQWTYDWTVFDRWTGFMEGLGIDRGINCYSMIPWKMTFDYKDAVTGEVRSVTDARFGDGYRSYWTHFLKAFRDHLAETGRLEKTAIAMDERPLESMRCALDILSEVPELKVSLAGNPHPEIEEKIYDYSVTSQKLFSPDVVEHRRQQGRVTTLYTCCAEAHPNTFLDSPTDEAAWIGWYCLAKGYDGYLRWAYNSWTADPLADARFTSWPAGDCFLVYPDGQSSVRFERLKEGIRSYEKCRILRQEWMEEGNVEALAELDRTLSLFNFQDLGAHGASDAVARAQAFLSQF